MVLIFHTCMHFRMQLAIVTFVVSTMVLAPALISNQPADAVTKCESVKGKSHTWISGCKDGWYNWDDCGNGPDGTGQYAEGYAHGWKLGQEHNPNRTGCTQ